MVEWELEVFGAHGRTGGVGRKVSFNCKGRHIQRGHKLPWREQHSSNGSIGTGRGVPRSAAGRLGFGLQGPQWLLKI